MRTSAVARESLEVMVVIIKEREGEDRMIEATLSSIGRESSLTQSCFSDIM